MSALLKTQLRCSAQPAPYNKSVSLQCLLKSSLSFSSPLQSFSGLPPGRSANFSLQDLNQNSHGFRAMKFSGNRWPMEHEITSWRARMLAEERESTSRAPILENGGTKSRTTLNAERNPTLRISPPNGTLLPGRTNSALGAGSCQCLNFNFVI